MIEEAEQALQAEAQTIPDVERPGDYLEDDSKKKSYMIKDPEGKIQVKNRS
jgi:hypothetical protein